MKIIYNEEERNIGENTTILDAFKNEIENSKFPVIGAKYNNEYKRLDYVLKEEGEVTLVDVASKGGMKIYRRTLIFIMAKAFEKLYPEIKIRVNYQLSNAMYCTLDNKEVKEDILLI